MSQYPVNSVAVLGAGTMGAQIALHFANAGIPSLLLDLTADLGEKNNLAAQNPEIICRLEAALAAWRKDVGVP